MKTFVSLALVSLLGITASAQANTVTFTASKPITSTNWSDILSLGKFNTALGTLNSIRFDLTGTVQGIGKAESLDASATNVTLSLGSTLTLTRPDASTLVVSNPLFAKNFSFTSFDGAIDFGGTSGGSTGTQTSSKSNSFTSTSANDFALFSALGGGLINLGLSGVGVSNGSGSGNLITSFQTASAGNTSVTYDYTAAPVPEPETYAMMLAGIGLLAFANRRKASKALTK